MIAAMSGSDITIIDTEAREVLTEIPTQPLTVDEDRFALGFVECGGNIRRAWFEAFGAEVTYSAAKAHKMLGQANVALRIKQLQEYAQDHMLLTLGSHLIQLAEIRDVAMARGETKVALNAEISRGEAVGIYSNANGKGKGQQSPQQFTFVINNKNDINI